MTDVQPIHTASADVEVQLIGGAAVTSYASLITRLTARYPQCTIHEIEAIVLREHEAFTGGVPVAVPAIVEDGAREILSARFGSSTVDAL